MRLNIFSRLFLGYIAIILVLGAINAYSVFTLHRLNVEVTLIFNRDQSRRRSQAEACRFPPLPGGIGEEICHYG